MQLGDAELARDRDLGVAVHGEGNQAVHVGRAQAGVVQRGPDRLDGQPQLAAAGVLGELGRADPDDRAAAVMAGRSSGLGGHDVVAEAAPAGHRDHLLVAVRPR